MTADRDALIQRCNAQRFEFGATKYYTEQLQGLTAKQSEYFMTQRAGAERRIDELESMISSGEAQYAAVVNHAVELERNLRDMRNEVVKNQQGYINLDGQLAAARRASPIRRLNLTS